MHSVETGSYCNKFYFTSNYGGIDCHYEVNAIDALTPIIEIPLSCERIQLFSKACIENLNTVHSHYNQAIRAIANHLKWVLPEDDSQVAMAFTEHQLRGDMNAFQHLDLSNLDLRLLPPQIKKFTQLNSLNVSGNKLLYLLPELQLLPLTCLDISGNIHLNPLPEWISTKSALKLVANGFRCSPQGLSQEFCGYSSSCSEEFNSNIYV